ncbi:rod shape-determining protein MreD [Sphingomonas sp. BGYR3]|uniref:rod shape-determining protein MreD n=1 Tax=Sphingomonas sp. BGYR3 TaxID=2975483 RepID=UPI0021A809A3|nr:rod shape-determining protein MreD [Sphingomonas sp. BGYR3]MDG5487383.1 rod shape-determining protein MreD [Sphingomonas sp. BGYR3]
MTPSGRSLLGADERVHSRRWLMPAAVMVGSLLSLLPLVATAPLLPPFGLMLLIGWRFLMPGKVPAWFALPLGLFDDLVSGQPVGSAVVLWTLCLLGIDVLDTRLMWRSFWQDWLVASGAVAFCLIGGRIFAAPLSSHVDTALMIQIAASVVLLPVVFRIAAWLDLKRVVA